MKSINDLFKEKIHWKTIPKNIKYFETNSYPQSECYLRINDFPEEPMWTLFYKGESIDFDDKPNIWKITYRSKLK